LKTLIGGPKLEHLLVLLQRAVHHEGAIVEFGVYHGGTLKIMAETYPDRMCYGFDTWDGLPVERVASDGTTNAIFRLGPAAAARKSLFDIRCAKTVIDQFK